jgi:hypothetical protein
MEPPLEVRGEQLLRPSRVAGVERLVQAQHQELAALLLRLPACQLRCRVVLRRRRRSGLLMVSQFLP